MAVCQTLIPVQQLGKGSGYARQLKGEVAHKHEFSLDDKIYYIVFAFSSTPFEHQNSGYSQQCLLTIHTDCGVHPSEHN